MTFKFNPLTGKFDLSGGGGGTPAAPNRSVQFNNISAFGGDENLSWWPTAGSGYDGLIAGNNVNIDPANAPGGYLGRGIFYSETYLEGGGDIGIWNTVGDGYISFDDNGSVQITAGSDASARIEGTAFSYTVGTTRLLYLDAAEKIGEFGQFDLINGGTGLQYLAPGFAGATGGDGITLDYRDDENYTNIIVGSAAGHFNNFNLQMYENAFITDFYLQKIGSIYFEVYDDTIGPERYAILGFTGPDHNGTGIRIDDVAQTVEINGTITNGTWQGTKIGLAYGGTNADLSATGGAANYLKQISTGAAITVGTIPYADITGTPTALPPSGSAGGELSGTYPDPSLSNGAVIAKVLTGYTSGAGTISASDSILSAIQKLNGNTPTTLPPSGTAGGDLAGTYPNPTLRSGLKLDSRQVTFDGQGAVLSANNYVSIFVPFAGTITTTNLHSYDASTGADTNGSMVIDIKRSGSSIIGGGNKPTLSSSASQTLTPASWTSVTVAAGDELQVFISGSPTSVTKATLNINFTIT